MRILKNFRYFYSFVLASFVRANFNHKSEKFKKLYNFNLAIFFNDTLSNEIQINGVYEKEELNLISKIIDKEIFIDVGANIGNHTLYFRNHFKKIYSFEPHPKTYKLLQLNTEDTSNIEVFNFGLSNLKKKKIIRFKSGKNVAGETFRYENKQGREVFFERFDDLYNFENSISFIKIDVEGNELDVLRSMKKNLENNSPIISLEFDMKDFTNICKTHGEWNRSKQQHEADLTFLRGSGCWDCGRIEIISFLRELGYKKFYFFKTNKPLGTRVRDIFVNFFRIIFMGYTNEIELMDSDFFDNNKFYIKDHIIISKQEIKNIF